MDTSAFLLKYLELRRNASRSPRETGERSLEKFRKFIKFVSSRSPYYSRIIREKGIDLSTCTPESFPVLTKWELMEHFDEIVTAPGVTKDGITGFLSRSKDPYDLYRGKYIVVHTSGSSGEIGYFVYSTGDWARGFAHLPRINQFTFRKSRLAFFGATQGHFAGITLITTFRRSFLPLFYGIETFDINSPVQPVLDGLNALQPHVLVGYPSGLLILAQKQETGELGIRPHVISSSGEPLGPEARRIIERAFGKPVRNLYVCSEHLCMGIAKPGSDGMYLFEDDLIFEIHPNHTYVTNLFNHTTPLIRYRMEDALRPIPDRDREFPFTKVGEIVGRMEQAPVFMNRHGSEDFISPHIINEFHARGLRRFQLQVLSRTSFRFRAALEPYEGDAERRDVLENIGMKLREILKQKEMDNVTFEIEEVDDLRVDPKTGKFRLIVH